MKYLKLIQFLFLFFLIGQSFAQTSQIDSLKSTLRKLEDDTSKVNTLIAICQQEYRQNQEDAILYGHKALVLSKKLNYGKGKALAGKFIGLAHYYKGYYFVAINFWEGSLRNFEAINDKVGVANILNNIGAVYWAEGDDIRALDYYLRSLGEI